MPEERREPTERRSPALIRHFSDLIVWQKAHEASLLVFRLSRKWPNDERFALIDQVRRASRSVGANIAEAWAKRRYEAAFVAKLTDSDGEANETEHWLICAEDHGYSTRAELAPIRDLLAEVGRMLGSMMSNPAPFLLKRPADR